MSKNKFAPVAKLENAAGMVVKRELPLVRVILYVTCVLNMIYVVTNLSTGIQERSLWHGLLGVYYLLLAVMQLAIVIPALSRSFGEDQLLEFRRYRLCGLILFVMNVLITVLIAVHIQRDTPYGYSAVKLVLLAIFDISLFFVAIFNIFYRRKYKSPLLSAASAISLTSAMVALLSLETAILTGWADVDEIFRTKMIAVTGAVICAIVLLVSLFMLIRGSVNLKRMEK